MGVYNHPSHRSQQRHRSQRSHRSQRCHRSQTLYCIIIIYYCVFDSQVISIYKYVQITRKNGNLKDISYYNVSKKEVDLAEIWIPMIFYRK